MKNKLHLTRYFKIIYIIFTTLLILGCTNNNKSQKHYFTVQFLAVGDADAIFVACDDEYMMIDFGKKGDNTTIDNFLKEEKVEKFKYIVCTHPHDDHFGGYESVLKRKKWGTTVYCSTKDESQISTEFNRFREKAGKIKVPKVGDHFSLGEAKVEVLAVNVDRNNDSSIVLMITYGNTKFLFTGDAEKKTEQYLIHNNKDIKCDVLKIAHHGSSTSTSEDFLNKCKPTYAVFCSGSNGYSDVADRLENRKIEWFSTDKGRIIAKSDGKRISFTNSNGETLIN